MNMCNAALSIYDLGGVVGLLNISCEQRPRIHLSIKLVLRNESVQGFSEYLVGCLLNISCILWARNAM